MCKRMRIKGMTILESKHFRSIVISFFEFVIEGGYDSSCIVYKGIYRESIRVNNTRLRTVHKAFLYECSG